MRDTDQGLPLLPERSWRARSTHGVQARQDRPSARRRRAHPCGSQPRKRSTATLHWAWAGSWTTTEGLAKTSTTLQRTSAPWGRQRRARSPPCRRQPGPTARLCAAGRDLLRKPLCDYPIQQPTTTGTWRRCAAGHLRASLCVHRRQWACAPASALGRPGLGGVRMQVGVLCPFGVSTRWHAEKRGRSSGSGGGSRAQGGKYDWQVSAGQLAFSSHFVKLLAGPSALRGSARDDQAFDHAAVASKLTKASGPVRAAQTATRRSSRSSPSTRCSCAGQPEERMQARPLPGGGRRARERRGRAGAAAVHAAHAAALARAPTRHRPRPGGGPTYTRSSGCHRPWQACRQT